MAADVLDGGEGSRPRTAGTQSRDGEVSTAQGSRDGGDDLDDDDEEEGGGDSLDDDDEEEGEEGDGGVVHGEEEEERPEAGQLGVEALRLHSTLSEELRDTGTFSMAVSTLNPHCFARNPKLSIRTPVCHQI